MSAAGQSSRFW